MALNLLDTIRKLRSGVEEVRGGFTNTFRKPSDREIFRINLDEEASRRLVGTPTPQIAPRSPARVKRELQQILPSLAPTEEEARKQLLVKIPSTTFGRPQRFLDPIGAVGVLGVKGLSFVKKAISPSKTKIKDLIKKRYGEIGSAQIDSAFFTNRIRRALTSVEREAVPFIAEKTSVPKSLNRPDIEQVVAQSSNKVREVVSSVRDYLDEAHEFLLKEVGDDVGFIEDFVPRLWDIPKNKKTAVVNWFATVKNNPHLKKRTISTINEGVEKFGLRPKTLDVAELINIYDNWKIKTVANTRFANSITKLADETGQKLIQRVDKAPADWVTFAHPALRRAMGIPLKEGQLLINKVPVKVHPDIAHEMNVIFQEPFKNTAISAFQGVNAFLKKTQLSISLFHHAALTEVAIPIIGFRKTARLWNPVKIYKAIKNDDYDIFNRIPLAKDGMEHGLQLGALEDVQRNLIQNALITAEVRLKNVVVAGKVATGIRKANEVWDKALWEYYHNTLKLDAYEGLVQSELRKSSKNVDQVKEEMAQFVNDTFGGQAWELLGKTPQWRQVMHWALLSPDWTWSTIRQALSPTGIGAVNKATRGVRARVGAQFWVKAGIYFYGGMNILNGVNSQKHLGEWRWMWENDPGHKTLLFNGFDDEGRKKYVRWGKQFRELPEALIDPVKKFGAKLSPAVQQTFIQATGASAGGFRTELGEELEAGKSFLETLPARGKELLKAPIPFAIQGAIKSGSPLTFVFPVSKGLSKWEGRQFFKQAIKDRDIDKVREVYRALLENNLDAEGTFQQAKSEVKRGQTIDNKKQAEELIKELRDLGRERGVEALQEIRDKGTLTPEIEEQMSKILNAQLDVSTQRKALEETGTKDISDRNILGLVSDYVKGFTTDPGNAFKALFTKEKLGVVQGNLVELQRFYGIRFDDEGGSEEFKRNLMNEQGIPLSDIENWKLEHITPVKAGGSTDDENLILVNNEMHNFFTPIDVAVGNAVKRGKITRKEAERLMRDFKVNKSITAESVIESITQ